jgi:hypothetical protein
LAVSPAATFHAVVVFPTPPFCEAMAIRLVVLCIRVPLIDSLAAPNRAYRAAIGSTFPGMFF